MGPRSCGDVGSHTSNGARVGRGGAGEAKGTSVSRSRTVAGNCR